MNFRHEVPANDNEPQKSAARIALEHTARFLKSPLGLLGITAGILVPDYLFVGDESLTPFSLITIGPVFLLLKKLTDRVFEQHMQWYMQQQIKIF